MYPPYWHFEMDMLDWRLFFISDYLATSWSKEQIQSNQSSAFFRY